MEDIAPLLRSKMPASASIKPPPAAAGAAAAGSLPNFNKNASFQLDGTCSMSLSGDASFPADHLLPRNAARLHSGRSLSTSVGGVGDAIGGQYDDVFGGPPKLSSQSMRMRNYDAVARSSMNGAGIVRDSVVNRVSAAGLSPAAFDNLMPRFEAAEAKAKTMSGMNAQRSISLNLGALSVEDLRGTERRAPALADIKSSEKDGSAKKAIHVPFQTLESDPVVSSAALCSLSNLDPLHAQMYCFDSSEKMTSSNGFPEGITHFKNILPCTRTASSASTESTCMLKESVKRGNSSTTQQTKPIENGKFEVDSAFNGGSICQRGEDLPQKGSGDLKFGAPVLFKKVEESRNPDKLWITIDDLMVVTQPSTASPPSRLPPVLGAGVLPALRVSEVNQDVSTSLHEISEFQQSVFCSRRISLGTRHAAKVTSTAIAGLKGLVSSGSKLWKETKENVATSSFLDEEQRVGSAAVTASAVAMKEAMERAEAKLKLAKETREKRKAEREVKIQEREDERRGKIREKKEWVQGHEKEEQEARVEHEVHEREEKERHERGIEARGWKYQDREKEKAGERDKTWEREKIAFERANQEAWERVEAQDRSERSNSEVCERAEMAAVGKARERDRMWEREKISFERANQEAWEREEARDRAERSSSEVWERAEVAAVEKARVRDRTWEREKIAFERASQEACERVEAHDRAERSSSDVAAVEKARERDRTWEREKIAFERANQEARERLEAHDRAERSSSEVCETAEMAAVEKARERERTWEREKIAFERANQGAWERMEAQNKTERDNTKVLKRAELAAVERAAAEARSRVEHAIVERANAVAHERAQKAALERAAESGGRAERIVSKKLPAAGRKDEQRNSYQCDSSSTEDFQPSGIPKQGSVAMETSFDVQQRSTSLPSDGQWKNSTRAASTGKSYSTNTVDDCMAFSAVPSFEIFQEVEGETSEHRRPRWEHCLQTCERASKALEEKHQRDVQSQKEQDERHRAADMLDVEIKLWAAGKEGNLCALLCTLQYVLWPECGWHPVSLRELNSAEIVRKVYRKATLCVHPDKVQQKGATIQQKYIAEKVFDILKEAWNQFSTKGLFLGRIHH